jgi:hypothetical protein
MEKYYFMRSVLDWLREPRHFNRMAAITLRIVATLAVPLSLVSFFKAGKVIFNLPPSGILGGIVFQVLFVLAVYCVVHALFIRARQIDALSGGDYNMFPLAAIVTRAAGEAFASFVGLVAVGGGIFIWFTGKGIETILNPTPYFVPVFGDTTFLGGIQFMAGGILSAFGAIGLAYLLAEALNLVEDLAQRRNQTRQNSAETPYKLRSGTGP